eukprot:s1402_g8.t1
MLFSSPELQKGIDGSRKVEWDKWKQFNAAIDLDENHYRELIAEGHEEVPLKWVDTDKNDARRGSQPDRGRKFWKRLKTSATRKGFKENSIPKALYALHNSEGRLIALLCTHVDDLLWAAEPEAEPISEQLLGEFSCGKIERREFRYCGKEIKQADDFSITVTCRETTLKVKRIFIAPKRKAGEPLTEKDKTQLKSVAGIFSWVTRQCRPDLAYRVSRMQSASNGGTVADLREANKAVDYALATPQRGLVYRSGVLDWDNLIFCVITDASHANEHEVMTVDKEDSLELHRSQGARLNCLGTPSLMSSDEDLWMVLLELQDGSRGVAPLELSGVGGEGLDRARPIPEAGQLDKNHVGIVSPATGKEKLDELAEVSATLCALDVSEVAQTWWSEVSAFKKENLKQDDARVRSLMKRILVEDEEPVVGLIAHSILFKRILQLFWPQDATRQEEVRTALRNGATHDTVDPYHDKVMNCGTLLLMFRYHPKGAEILKASFLFDGRMESALAREGQTQDPDEIDVQEYADAARPPSPELL